MLAVAPALRVPCVAERLRPSGVLIDHVIVCGPVSRSVSLMVSFLPEQASVICSGATVRYDIGVEGVDDRDCRASVSSAVPIASNIMAMPTTSHLRGFAHTSSACAPTDASARSQLQSRSDIRGAACRSSGGGMKSRSRRKGCDVDDVCIAGGVATGKEAPGASGGVG